MPSAPYLYLRVNFLRYSNSHQKFLTPQVVERLLPSPIETSKPLSTLFLIFKIYIPSSSERYTLNECQMVLWFSMFGAGAHLYFTGVGVLRSRSEGDM
jgi:hypothetical protein